MTYREMMEAIEPGGPPYGVISGARLDMHSWLEQLGELSENDAELILTEGDMIDIPYSHRKEKE